MEVLTFDFNNSFQNLESFKQQTHDTFTKLVETTAAAAQDMSNNFLSFTQTAAAVALGTSAEVSTSFDVAYASMAESLNSALNSAIEKATTVSAQLGTGFA